MSTTKDTKKKQVLPGFMFPDCGVIHAKNHDEAVKKYLTLKK